MLQCWVAETVATSLEPSSLKLWHKLKKRYPDCPVRFNGTLLWEDDPDAVAAQVARMTSLGWECALLDRAQVVDRMQGLFAPEAALFAPMEGSADPARITDWMHSKGAAAGVKQITATVAAFEPGRVTLADGQTVTCDAILVALGLATSAFFDRHNLRIPMRHSPGVLMRLGPLPPVIPHVFATPEVDFWQTECGEIYASASLGASSPEAVAEVVSETQNALQERFPGMPGLTAKDVILRHRPIPLDGFPVIGKSGIEGLWLGVMHSGMTLAPVVAEALADDILGRDARHDVSHYQVTRSFSGLPEEAVSWGGQASVN